MPRNNKPFSVDVLMEAIGAQDVGWARDILESGISPNDMGKGSSSNLPPIVYAVIWFRDLEMLRLLVTHGANLERARGDNGFTPLIQSIYNGHYEATVYLIAHGADPEHRDKRGLSPLDYAKEKPTDDYTRLIGGVLKARADAAAAAAEAERQSTLRATALQRQAALKSRTLKPRL